MEKDREIYEGLRPLNYTCCEDNDRQPCPNKILYVDNVDLDADFRCVDNNESKYSYVSSYALMFLIVIRAFGSLQTLGVQISIKVKLFLIKI